MNTHFQRNITAVVNLIFMDDKFLRFMQTYHTAEKTKYAEFI